MAKYKNITIKKRSGGTRKQRVMVLATGKYKFVKNKKTGSRSLFKRKIKGRSRIMVKKKRKSSKKKTSAVWKIISGALLYGAAREYVSTKIAPVSNKLFGQYLGDYTDEAGMLGLSYLLIKGKIPFVNKIAVVKDAAKVGLGIEAARIGEGLVRGGLGLGGSETGSIF